MRTLVGNGSAHTILAPAAAIDRVERREPVMAPIVAPALVRPVYLVRNPARPVTQASRAVEQVPLEGIGDLVRRGIWRAHPCPPTATRRPYAGTMADSAPASFRSVAPAPIKSGRRGRDNAPRRADARR